jgi:hypothetical protein
MALTGTAASAANVNATSMTTTIGHAACLLYTAQIYPHLLSQKLKHRATAAAAAPPTEATAAPAKSGATPLSSRLGIPG